MLKNFKAFGFLKSKRKSSFVPIVLTHSGVQSTLLQHREITMLAITIILSSYQTGSVN